jgi:2-polyprenyl-3-methyl-5-hydroxy-6-metoxy-1,4-benzoquinol methylase
MTVSGTPLISSSVQSPSQSMSASRISLYEFGSSEDTIRRIQKPFVEFFRNSAPVLDIGCGRGIFLQLLADAGIDAVGIDHSGEALAACREKGFNVYHEDAKSYLSAEAGRFGGIFCSHVIEHMSYEDALAFVDLCYRALRPGGLLLLVTPNPEDICIMSDIFWLDPTHVRPYPKLLLQAMLGSAGFQVRQARQFLGSWRLVGGRRNLPGYLLRRLLLGRYFGRPNTMVLAEKSSSSGTVA